MAPRTGAGRRIFIAAILARRRREASSGSGWLSRRCSMSVRAAFPCGRMRAIPRGAGNQGGEARGLRRREAARADAEERARRGLAAVGRLAEFDRREIDLEDPLLRDEAVEGDGDRGLASLAPPRAFAGEPQVLRELLRERRGAAQAPPAVSGVGAVPVAGGPDRVPVDAAVLEERASSAVRTAWTRTGATWRERHRAAVDRVAPALPRAGAPAARG